MKKHISAIVLASVLSACASNPDNITAAYVSPGQYNSYNCAQLREEVSRVSVRAAQIGEVARLKGEMEAVEHASIQKKCGIQFQRAEPKSPA